MCVCVCVCVCVCFDGRLEVGVGECSVDQAGQIIYPISMRELDVSVKWTFESSLIH